MGRSLQQRATSSCKQVREPADSTYPPRVACLLACLCVCLPVLQAPAALQGYKSMFNDLSSMTGVIERPSFSTSAWTIDNLLHPAFSGLTVHGLATIFKLRSFLAMRSASSLCCHWRRKREAQALRRSFPLCAERRGRT